MCRKNMYFFLSLGLSMSYAQEPDEITLTDDLSNPENTVIIKLEPVGNEKVLNCTGQSGHHVYPVDNVCPLGGETFRSLALGTHSTFGRYLDWQPISYLQFPVSLPVCPANGFVITKAEYTSDEVDQLKIAVESDEYRQFYDDKHASYFLYAKIVELSGGSTSDNWWLYLNASWEAHNCGDENRYAEYAKLFMDEAKIKLASSQPEDVKLHWILNIIVANVQRRTGDFAASKAWLDGVSEPLSDNEDINQSFRLAKRLLFQAIEANSTAKIQFEDDDSD